MEPNQKSNGALVGAIIIVLILVLGGIYYWTTKVPATAPATTEESVVTDDGTPLTDEELNSLEAELGAESDLGAGIDTVE